MDLNLNHHALIGSRVETREMDCELLRTCSIACGTSSSLLDAAAAIFVQFKWPHMSSIYLSSVV